MTFVGGHAVWSIAVPIAVVETLVPERRTTPWPGRAGLTVTAVVFLVGATAIFRDQTEQFLATVPQMAGTVAAAAALVPAAFAVGWSRRTGWSDTHRLAGRGYPSTRSGVCLAITSKSWSRCSRVAPERTATAAIRQSVRLRTVSPPARQRR